MFNKNNSNEEVSWKRSPTNKLNRFLSQKTHVIESDEETEDELDEFDPWVSASKLLDDDMNSVYSLENFADVTEESDTEEFNDLFHNAYETGNLCNRSWMYTWNNYTKLDEDYLRNLHEQHKIIYHCFGKEEAPQTGTIHIHGCITFKDPKRRSTVAKILKSKVWLEMAKNINKCRAYCVKDGNDIFTFDNRRRGKRSDLDAVVVDCVAKHSFKQIAMKHPNVFIKYHRGIERLSQFYTVNDTPRTEKPTVTWCYGTTGTGKSRIVFECEKDRWVSSNGFKYFNGYENQEAAILDDFRAKDIDFQFLLQLLDWNEMTVNVKFGHRQWNSKRIYFTTCQPPHICFRELMGTEDLEQLMRRIDNSIEFNKTGLFVKKGTNPFKKPVWWHGEFHCPDDIFSCNLEYQCEHCLKPWSKCRRQETGDACTFIDAKGKLYAVQNESGAQKYIAREHIVQYEETGNSPSHPVDVTRYNESDVYHQ